LCLKEDIETNQDTRAEKKAMRARRMEANINAWREETTACQDAMKANLDKTEPNLGGNQAAVERRETLNEEVAVHPLRECRNETMACQETMQARLQEEKPASMELKPEVADEEVPLEDAAVIPV
jgi:hypothetical protein